MSATTRTWRSIHDYVKKVYTLSSAKFTKLCLFLKKVFISKEYFNMCESFMAQKQT